jgi:hypothetical protein
VHAPAGAEGAPGVRGNVRIFKADHFEAVSKFFAT